MKSLFQVKLKKQLLTKHKRKNQVKNWIVLGLFVLIASVMTGCASKGLNNPGNTPLNHALTQLKTDIHQDQTVVADMAPPSMVMDSLIAAPAPLAKMLSKDQRHFDVSANAVPAQEFFMSLVKGTPYNIVVSPKIQGTITLHLNHVTIEQVLAAIKDSYGYQYRKEPYGFQVYPQGLQTRIFTVHYLDMVRSGSSSVSVESGLINQQQNQTTSASGQTTTSTAMTSVPGSKLTSTSTVNFWHDLQASLEAIVANVQGGKVVLDPSSGFVVVTAMPEQLDQIAEYLDHLNNVVSKQVLIEAEVIDVILNKGFESGIDWSLLGAKQTGNTTLDDDLTPFTSIFTLTGSVGGSLKATLNLLSTQGNVQVLSSPRVSALNNQKAMIKIGRDEYFVTEVSNTVAGTGSDAQATQNIHMEPFFSGVSLAVTPTIVNNHHVMLEIHPIISTVSDSAKTVLIDDKKTTIPSAKSEIDETDSVVFAQSGQVIALSGLIQDTAAEQLGSTPFLGDIPFAGSLFRRTSQSSVRSELVILIRPLIIDNHAWVSNLEKTHERLGQLNRGYHFGAYPQRFGNQGEMQGVENLPFSAPASAVSKVSEAS